MTDSEKLDLILNKMNSLESDVKDIKKTTQGLKEMDTMIFEEVERVHEILEKHIENAKVHMTV